MSKFEIVTLKTGIKSLRSLEYQETFHPVTGPWAEAQILHVDQQGLRERSQEFEKFVIWDVGFGAAANSLAAVAALQNLSGNVTIHSFEKDLSSLQFALSYAGELGYLEEFRPLLEKLLESGVAQIREDFLWKLHVGDFRKQLENSGLPSPHAILYDPYSPQSNPEVWNLEHFEALYLRLDSNVPCLLTNYTRSTAVRVTLLMAGFFVGRGCEVGEKAETTVVSNRLDLLQDPLGPIWLDRVRVSGNAAPMRGDVYSQGRISPQDFERLCAHPQFCTA